MSLTAGVWSQRDAQGSITPVLFTDIPVADRRFNGGTPADITGKALIAPFASGYNVEVSRGGIGYHSSGAVVTDLIGPVVAHVGGVPITDVGALAIEVAAPVSYVAGIPMAASGRVAFGPTVAPTNLHAFDSGFDQGAFN